MMKHYKVLLLLFLVIFPISSLADADIEVLYTRAQVDSIITEAIKSEVAKQVVDTVHIIAEKVTHDNLGTYITEHDSLISYHLIIMGFVFTFLAGVVGIGFPLKQNKEIEKKLEKQNKEFEEKLEKQESTSNDTIETVKKWAKEAEASKLFVQAINEKDASKAIELYGQAIKMKEDYAEAYNNRGLLKYNNKQYEDALEDLQKAIDQNSAFSEAYYNRGLVREENRDIDGAIADFKEAIKLKPMFPLPYIRLGYLKYINGKIECAMKDYEKAKELSPDNADVYNYLGLLKKGCGDMEGALADYNRAIRLNPSKADFYYNRGLLKDNMHDYDGACADYNEVIELNPKHDSAYNNRAYTLFKSAKGSKAILQDAALKDVNIAIGLNDKNYNYYGTRGEIYLSLNEYLAASSDFTRAIELNNNDIESYENRSKCFSKLEEKARKDEEKKRWRAKAEADKQKVDELRGGTK